MPVACFGLEVSFGVNHNQREWKTFSWAFYFYHSFGVNHNQREWKTFSWAFYFYHSGLTFLGGPAVLGGGVGVGGCDGVVGTGGGGGPGGFLVVVLRGGAWGVGARADVDPRVCAHGLRLVVGRGLAAAAVVGHALYVGCHRGLVGGRGRCWWTLASFWPGRGRSVALGCGL